MDVQLTPLRHGETGLESGGPRLQEQPALLGLVHSLLVPGLRSVNAETNDLKLK